VFREKLAAQLSLLPRPAVRTKAFLLHRWHLLRLAMPGQAYHLEQAIKDIHTADAGIGNTICDGYLNFKGQSVLVQDVSQHIASHPSSLWTRHFAGFTWLRDIRLSSNPHAGDLARELVKLWLKSPVASSREPQALAVTAVRVLSLLSHSPFLLDNASADFYHSFIRGLKRDCLTLLAYKALIPQGLGRLHAAMAITAAACGFSHEPWRKNGVRFLLKELRRQIFPDGGYIGRNPAYLIDIALRLLPLHYVIKDIDPQTAADIDHILKNILQRLRFFRHSNGELAFYHGAYQTQRGQIATVLTYDRQAEVHDLEAPQSGYHRLEMGQTVLFIDNGQAPPYPYSAQAHASCLAIEISHQDYKIITNCGVDLAARHDEMHSGLLADHRRSHSHSTLVIDNIDNTALLEQVSGTGDHRFYTLGPTHITKSLKTGADSLRSTSAHNGYHKSFGYTHARSVVLEKQGLLIKGQDVLIRKKANPKDKAVFFAVHFHLPPFIRVQTLPEGLALQCGENDVWVFQCREVQPVLAETVLYLGSYGRTPSKQILLQGQAGETLTLNWSLSKQSLS
jgi:uncharacterized heparinase superfamily protein